MNEIIIKKSTNDDNDDYKNPGQDFRATPSQAGVSPPTHPLPPPTFTHQDLPESLLQLGRRGHGLPGGLRGGGGAGGGHGRPGVAAVPPRSAPVQAPGRVAHGGAAGAPGSGLTLFLLPPRSSPFSAAALRRLQLLRGVIALLTPPPARPPPPHGPGSATPTRSTGAAPAPAAPTARGEGKRSCLRFSALFDHIVLYCIHCILLRCILIFFYGFIFIFFYFFTFFFIFLIFSSFSFS